jgi:cob(I)alamin adenosyltransferase
MENNVRIKRLAKEEQAAEGNPRGDVLEAISTVTEALNKLMALEKQIGNQKVQAILQKAYAELMDVSAKLHTIHQYFAKQPMTSPEQLEEQPQQQQQAQGDNVVHVKLNDDQPAEQLEKDVTGSKVTRGL